jgi:hypothetical protein
MSTRRGFIQVLSAAGAAFFIQSPVSAFKDNFDIKKLPMIPTKHKPTGAYIMWARSPYAHTSAVNVRKVRLSFVNFMCVFPALPKNAWL